MSRSPCFLISLVALLASCAGQRPVANSEAEHSAAMAREHAGHTPDANAATRAPAGDVVAEEVIYATIDGREIRGYLARPLGSPTDVPGVLVIHEWWGLNENVRMMTRRLAGEGYAALAVDLYEGEVAESPARARELTGAVSRSPERAEQNLAQAAAYLRGRGAPAIGTLGWCFGGGWSLQAALAIPRRVDAAVMYYGRPVTDREMLARLDAPLLGIFGGADTGIPVERVREMESTLEALGKDVEIRVYPGARHAFANPSGQAYEPVAAADAWARTVAFFREHLREP